jgi:hypothetical protein
MTASPQGRAYGRIRNWFRQRLFALLGHVAELDEARQLFAAQLQLHNTLPKSEDLDRVQAIEIPYSDLPQVSEHAASSGRSDVVFITGRYRSGSTLLWNLFRHVPQTTAFSEPFNERRWFDLSARGTQFDETHLHVRDYWTEYQGLDHLGELFDDSWKFRQLYMDASSRNWRMQRYIEALVNRASGRAVLQFNEIDFRLPWLRSRFPGAKFLHVYRHPRSQWHSTMRGRAYELTRLTIADFAKLDGFYLLAWVKDLRNHFEIIEMNEDAHPYALFYLIWRLSHAFGRLHSDYSVALEDIVREPLVSVENIMSSAGVTDYDASTCASLVDGSNAGQMVKPEYDDFFREIETQVEEQLQSESLGAG